MKDCELWENKNNKIEQEAKSAYMEEIAKADSHEGRMEILSRAEGDMRLSAEAFLGLLIML